MSFYMAANTKTVTVVNELFRLEAPIPLLAGPFHKDSLRRLLTVRCVLIHARIKIINAFFVLLLSFALHSYIRRFGIICLASAS